MVNGTFCRSRLVIAIVLAAGLAAPSNSDDLPAEVIALAKATQQFHQDAAVLSSFACLETMERAQSKPKSGKLLQMDRVELEVTKIGHQEWFSWPGGESFHDDPSAMVGHGLVGSGEFLVTAQSALDGSHPIAFVDTTELMGRKAYHYKYEISPFAAHYHVKTLVGEADIGIRGDIWIDIETLDVLRVRSEGWQMPGWLGLDSLETVVSYERIPINRQMLLFPESAETTMRYASGREVRNVTEFSQCRSYETSSRLLAGEEAASSAPPPETNPLVTLPANLRIALELKTRIDTSMRVGTPIEAKLADRFRIKELGIELPSGARVLGRVRRMRPCSQNKSCWEVGIEFNEIDTPEHRFRFAARFVNVSAVEGVSSSLRAETHMERSQLDWVRSTITTETTTLIDLPGTASFFVTAPPYRLPSGMLMTWVTTKSAGAKQ